jgi:hypothetical protein
MVEHTYNPNTPRQEVCEFKASLSYIATGILCQKINKKKEPVPVVHAYNPNYSGGSRFEASLSK